MLILWMNILGGGFYEKKKNKTFNSISTDAYYIK